MAWRNTVTINIAQMGKIPGDCLYNTRVAPVPDIAAKYKTAHAAALQAQLKPGEPPKGVWSPAYFDFWATVEGKYQNAGHVGWVDPNGAFWSDGTRYASIYTYMAGHAPRYIGYGLLLNDKQILQWVPEAAPAPVQGSGTLHLDKGSITTTFDKNGNKVGSIYARDDTYDYTVRGKLRNMVMINSASGGGNGVYVAMTYLADGSAIPGREIK